MKELVNCKLILYKKGEETIFSESIPCAYLEIIPENMEEGFFISLKKEEYNILIDLNKEDKIQDI